MTTPITILIPTFNNPQYLNPCIMSIVRTGVLGGLCKLIVINNGTQPIEEQFPDFPNFEVLNPGKNLGWERGLEYGLQHTDSPFVVFQNDDTFIPKANSFFYHYLIAQFFDPSVAAVGPTTTNAAGWHSVFLQNPLMFPTEVSYLIFFTAMIRRSHLEEVGGIDVSAPGGDDLDLSIRFRKAGKKLMIHPEAFLIHHAFKTGERVRGGPDKVGGWNSKEMMDQTNKWLIQKHGFKTFFDTIRGIPGHEFKTEDLEGQVICKNVRGDEILELGCGGKKTIDHAIGVDIVPRGENIPNVSGIKSMADIVADVTKRLPFQDFSYDTIIARHILEHAMDTIETVRYWNRVLKMGGRLIIGMPDEGRIRSIPLNPEHVHAFDKKSLERLMSVCGFRHVKSEDSGNEVSFVAIYEKVEHYEDKLLDSLVLTNGHPAL